MAAHCCIFKPSEKLGLQMRQKPVRSWLSAISAPLVLPLFTIPRAIKLRSDFSASDLRRVRRLNGDARESRRIMGVGLRKSVQGCQGMGIGITLQINAPRTTSIA